MFGYEFFIDPSRCIGCESCVNACSECETHRGQSMIHLDFIDRRQTTATVPAVCMHCDDPTCAQVCPADAIKIDPEGVVLSALTERCIGCGNCALACPFGVPKIDLAAALMRKCDLCYDRTSVGKKPMCATVCPSQALFFGTREQALALRPQSMPTNKFRFGDQTITTRVNVMVPRQPAAPAHIDVTAAMEEQPKSRAARLRVINDAPDPFAEVEV